MHLLTHSSSVPAAWLLFLHADAAHHSVMPHSIRNPGSAPHPQRNPVCCLLWPGHSVLKHFEFLSRKRWVQPVQSKDLSLTQRTPLFYQCPRIT